MKTFYLAGSSAKRGEIAMLNSELRSLGMKPWNGHDWTQYAPEKPGMVENANLVSKDLLSAVNADLFVFYTHPDVITRGGWAEYGARISHFKAAHVVANGAPWHLFLEHGHTTVHEDWFLFRRWLLEHLGLPADGRVQVEKGLEPVTKFLAEQFGEPRLDSADYRARMLEEFPIGAGVTAIGERLPEFVAPLNEKPAGLPPGFVQEKRGHVLPLMNVGQDLRMDPANEGYGEPVDAGDRGADHECG